MARGHHATGRSYQHQELLYDPDLPAPSHAERARTLAKGVGTATLCTLAREQDGHPYGSFVTYGLHQGRPIFLVSTLAEHTRNLLGDPRASLLIAQPGEGDPLARARVTLVGRCSQLKTPEEIDPAREAFLERHPGASYYADYKDFAFWSLEPESARFIGGYGRMSWLEGEDWLGAAADPITPVAAPMISHMNEDHADTMVLYCRAYSRAEDTTEATMVGIDRYGFEMSALTGEGPRPIRVAFPEAVSSPKEVRGAMVALAKTAREQLGVAPHGEGKHG